MDENPVTESSKNSSDDAPNVATSKPDGRARDSNVSNVRDSSVTAKPRDSLSKAVSDNVTEDEPVETVISLLDDREKVNYFTILLSRINILMFTV